MPTNINTPVWTTGEKAFSGGGAQAAVLVPSDLDNVIINIADATGTDVVDVEVSADPRENLVGIVERPLRYTQAAINDLGSSGELRLNPASGQDFTADGWAVGDTFEVVNHVVPSFNSPFRVGGKPTTLGDTQIFTITSVAADVLAFSEDPAFSLAEGEIVVAQSRAALDESTGVAWVVQGSLDASSTETTIVLSNMGGKKIRLNQSTGTAAVTWELKGTRQSRQKDPTLFTVSSEDRPYAGYPSALAIGTLAAGPDAVAVWDEAAYVEGDSNVRRGSLQVVGADFEVAGVQPFDKVNVAGHSASGNKGIYTARSVSGDQIIFKERLKGSPGTDTPGRASVYYRSATLSVPQVGDYFELVLADMGAVAGSFFSFKDGEVTSGILDSGPDGVSGMDDQNVAVSGAGPWPGTLGMLSDSGNLWARATAFDGVADAGEEATLEGFFRYEGTPSGQDAYLLGNEDTFVLAGTDGTRELTVIGAIAALADPGAWAASTAYAQGDRVRPVVDDGTVMECEVAGTSAGTEPTWPAVGNTVADNTVTWRHVSDRADFHDFRLDTGVTPAVGEWFHFAVVREADGTLNAYVNGAPAASLAVADDDTTPGSFGDPKPHDFTVSFATTVGGIGGDPNLFNGDAAFCAFYHSALTAAQILNHYNTAVELGLNT